MDAVTHILAQATDAGLRLSPDGPRLRVRGPRSAMTGELRDALTERKAALLDLLRSAVLPPDPADWAPGCAAVLAWEIDAGRDPSQAEEHVRREWREYVLAGCPAYEVQITRT